MRCKGWKCNPRKTITVTYGVFCEAGLFLSVTLIYLNGIYRGARGWCSRGRNREKRLSNQFPPTPASFIIYGCWLQKYLIRWLVVCYCFVCLLCSSYVYMAYQKMRGDGRFYSIWMKKNDATCLTFYLCRCGKTSSPNDRFMFHIKNYLVRQYESNYLLNWMRVSLVQRRFSY